MGTAALEVADIFRTHGPAWRQAQRSHLSLGQLKVMTAIEQCRSAALGGHVLRCQDCDRLQVAYNSCRNRHCPKCQASAAQRWLDARLADLLPVDYFHWSSRCPHRSARSRTPTRPSSTACCSRWRHRRCAPSLPTPDNWVRRSVPLVLYTWGSALTHHPHVHGIVPGGGLSLDGQRWVSCRPGLFLPVRVLSRLFRRLFLEALEQEHRAGTLQFFSQHTALADPKAFARWLAPLHRCEWVVYAKKPFAGPQPVLAYLSRYTHRVAISNSRLVAHDERGVTFRWKDYRDKGRAQGKTRHKTMTLSPEEFMRRFLLHVLPGGFHRIRHYGLLANTHQRDCIEQARQLLMPEAPSARAEKAECGAAEQIRPTFVCVHCGAVMLIVETFARGQPVRTPHQRGPP
jgi:Putative transposase/Transposase zinc-binding domain